MHLYTLLANISNLKTLPNIDVSGLTLDSRKVQKNYLFIAMKGHDRDGNHYIQDAIEKGASAVIKAGIEPSLQQFMNVPILELPSLQTKVGEIAARFYDYPSKKIKIIGVTGTNGKTTCTHLCAEILSKLQHKAGVIGTLGSGFLDEITETGMTTPDAITLQQILSDFAKQHAKAVAMEVSSHSIHQHRINGIDFEAGLFTNLTQDHLDYHGTLENYANTKKKFLERFPVKHLIINADDAHGQEWINTISHSSITSYGFQNKWKSKTTPQVYAEDIEITSKGIQAFVYSPWGNDMLSLPLIGEFNLSNALGVLTSLCVLGVPFTDIIQAFKTVSAIPGRMQVISEQNHPLIVVDYAHTPDALEKVLKILNFHTVGKLICVFGCGGDRDKEKRPLMGEIAEKYSDLAIITNDNPRHEPDHLIAQQILDGFRKPNRAIVLLNRSKAIEKSIQLAEKSDCILIAGKGAERYQEISDERVPFDDVFEVKRYLKILEEKI